MANNLAENAGRKHFMRAFLKDGSLEILSDQDSSLLSVLQKSNALAIRQPNERAAQKGDLISYLELD